MLQPNVEHIDMSGPLAHFREHGYASLGQLLSEGAAERLAARAESLMMGPEPHPGLFYQHDSPTGRYEDLSFSSGWVGPSLRYRKLERLELDSLFLGWIENPLFARLAQSMLGDTVLLYRAVLWNKAAGGGMAVPWHQDDGKFWGLDRAPFFQIWTALDDASETAGCLEVVPGTHTHGLASPEGGTITEAHLTEGNAEERAIFLPAKRGECILVHNHLWHRTARNRPGSPRRALSISFLSGATRCTRRRRAPRQFRRLFGPSGSSLG